MIQVGERIPEVTLTRMTDQGPQRIKTSELFAGKRVVVFGLPGAFTPTCSNRHLPGYVEKADELRQKGVDQIVCLSVNDAFVMDAWGKSQQVGDRVMMLADGAADFTRAIGMEIDMSGYGMGVRSKRYSMLVEDGVVKQINLEENPGEAKQSGAETMLAQI
jgi:peroxiredoxin